jgi:hypothetical protein
MFLIIKNFLNKFVFVDAIESLVQLLEAPDNVYMVVFLCNVS